MCGFQHLFIWAALLSLPPSSEIRKERGVIFAEHERGNSEQGIGRLVGHTNGLLPHFMPLGTDLDTRPSR